MCAHVPVWRVSAATMSCWQWRQCGRQKSSISPLKLLPFSGRPYVLQPKQKHCEQGASAERPDAFFSFFTVNSVVPTAIYCPSYNGCRWGSLSGLLLLGGSQSQNHLSVCFQSHIFPTSTHFLSVQCKICLCRLENLAGGASQRQNNDFFDSPQQLSLPLYTDLNGENFVRKYDNLEL